MNDKETIEQFITYLQTINRYLRSAAFDRLGERITRVQWLLLRHLYRCGPQTIGQLAEHLDVRPSTMSQMIDRLEKVNLVARENDAKDARIRAVTLTPEGFSFIRHAEQMWTEALAEPFSHFSAHERSLLLELMEKLAVRVPKKDDRK